MLTNNKMRQFSVSDIFYGKLDLLFLFSEMGRCFGRQPMDE